MRNNDQTRKAKLNVYFIIYAYICIYNEPIKRINDQT